MFFKNFSGALRRLDEKTDGVGKDGGSGGIEKAGLGSYYYRGSLGDLTSLGKDFLQNIHVNNPVWAERGKKRKGKINKPQAESSESRSATLQSEALRWG